jgi:hypothetical protein
LGLEKRLFLIKGAIYHKNENKCETNKMSKKDELIKKKANKVEKG